MQHDPVDIFHSEYSMILHLFSVHAPLHSRRVKDYLRASFSENIYIYTPFHGKVPVQYSRSSCAACMTYLVRCSERGRTKLAAFSRVTASLHCIFSALNSLIHTSQLHSVVYLLNKMAKKSITWK